MPKLLHPRYLILGLGVAIFVWVVLVGVGMYEELVIILGSDLYTPALKLATIASMLSDPLSQLTGLSVVASMAVALLVGVQVVLLSYIKHARVELRRATTANGFISSILVALGMGCSACGSVVFLSILSVFGVGVGATFALWVTNTLLFLAVAILLYTNYWLYGQAKYPLACKI